MMTPNEKKDYDRHRIEALKEDLIRSLKAQGVIKSSIVEEAFRAIPRDQFVWPGTPKTAAYYDEPIPLGDTGQTLSAPSMIAIMLEELELSRGMHVLEVGAGSGYNAALIGYIVKLNNHVSFQTHKEGEDQEQQHLVISVEREHKLVEFADRNLKSVSLDGVVKVVEGDGTLGFPPRSTKQMYQRIVVSAAAPSLPKYLELQLKIDGILEIPLGNLAFQKLVKFRKLKVPDSEDEGRYKLTRKDVVDCMFVPLIGEGGYDF